MPACGSQGDDVIPQQPTQLSLSFDPDLADQFRSLKDCLSTRIYAQRGGITAVAGKLDLSPSHLSEALAGGGARNRKVDLDQLETYIEKYNDFTPILYLIARFMPDQAIAQATAVQRVAQMFDELPGLLAQFGANTKRTPARRRR